MSTLDSLNDVTDGLVTEEVDLSGMAEEPGGAWKKGWYKAEIIEGYATRKGTQFETADAPSKDGASRNLRLCFKVYKGEDERTIQTQLNYRSSDFNPDRIAHIKQLRTEFAGSTNWPDKDGHRSSLAMAKLGQLQAAVGFKLKTVMGAVDPTPFIGQKLDVYLNVDDNGYNDVKQFAKSGDKTR